MEQRICQSCAMPLTSEEMYGTNADGSVNTDYCKWCYDKGEFIEKCTMEEFIDKCSQFGEQAGMTNEQMKEYCTKVFPTLKRWQKAQIFKLIFIIASINNLGYNTIKLIKELYG